MPIDGISANSCQQLLQDELQQPLRRWDGCQGEEESTGPWPQSSSCNINSHLPFPPAASFRGTFYENENMSHQSPKSLCYKPHTAYMQVCIFAKHIL